MALKLNLPIYVLWLQYLDISISFNHWLGCLSWVPQLFMNIINFLHLILSMKQKTGSTGSRLKKDPNFCSSLKILQKILTELACELLTGERNSWSPDCLRCWLGRVSSDICKDCWEPRKPDIVDDVSGFYKLKPAEFQPLFFSG